MSIKQDLKNSMRFIQRVAKNSYNSYTDAQVCTRDATSNSSSRTTAAMLESVARYSDTEYNAVASVLWKRLTDYKYRRHVLKALIVIEYLLTRAGEQFMADVVERIDVIRRLKMFKYFKNGHEVGYEVRDQASRVMALLENFDDLMIQRQQLQETGQRLALPSTGYIFGEDAAEKKPNRPLELEYHNYDYNREDKYAEPEPEAEPVVVVEEDAEQDEEMPKKKRGKKLRRKKAKRMVSDEDNEEVEEKMVIVPVANESGAGALDDFLFELANPKSVNVNANEKALVPVSSVWENTQPASVGQLGWLTNSVKAVEAKPVAEESLLDFGYGVSAPEPQVNGQWNAYAAPANAPKKQHDDFSWMN